MYSKRMCIGGGGGMKENDGKASRQRTLRMALGFIALQMAVVLVYMIVRVEEGPSNVHHIRIPSAPQHHHNGHPQEQAILEARYFLIDVKVPHEAVAPNNENDSYQGAKGIFCPLDWHLQKENPSSVAMFKDLVTNSKHCDSHRVELDLHSMVQKVRAYDQEVSHVHQLPLSGVVFHETRCGSTLVANLLAGFDPLANRVYSEAAPLLSTMMACGEDDFHCDAEKTSALLQDVLYLMGRTSDPREKRFFAKIQSVGVLHISSLTRVFPDVPWIFVYRDSVEVMMSHFPKGDATHAVCLRSRHHPHGLVRDMVQDHGRAISLLSNYEFCAAHLASLCQSAIREHEATGHGRFVNYASLPESMWESIVPDYFGIQLSAHHAQQMKQVAGVYSKGHGSAVVPNWEQDSTEKRAKASPELQKAAETFLSESLDRLEKLSSLSQIER